MFEMLFAQLEEITRNVHVQNQPNKQNICEFKLTISLDAYNSVYLLTFSFNIPTFLKRRNKFSPGVSQRLFQNQLKTCFIKFKHVRLQT